MRGSASVKERQNTCDDIPGERVSNLIQIKDVNLKCIPDRRKRDAPHVRFGSKADITTDGLNVRFAPESGRHLTTHAFGQQRMPLDKGTADQTVREPASTSR
jgi:hypothetical protein